ncbi:MAG: multicopper oxidase domain-containing protein [Bacteroidota bacterium]
MDKCYPRLLAAFLLMCMVSFSSSYAQFTIDLVVPDLIDSSFYQITTDVETHDFGATGFDNVTTFAYNHDGDSTNDYLGPTMVWEVGRTQTTRIINRLGTNNTTTVHWHGANIPAWTDGGPHQTIAPGDTFVPVFDIIEKPASLWYHPHAEDATLTQVQMGLAGMIIIRDPQDAVEPILPTNYGVDDFPIIIQDLKVDNDGNLDTNRVGGGTNIVNGTIRPVLNVPPQVIRLRILNGSTRASQSLMIVADTSNTVAAGRKPYSLLASDGGYISDSVRTIDSLLNGPGIRNEILIDFTGEAGQTYYLYNRRNSIPNNFVKANDGPLMQIQVGQNTVSPMGAIPTSLPNIPVLGPPDNTRIVDLGGQGAGNNDSLNPLADSLKFNINGRQFVIGTIDDTVNLGTIEDWQVRNTSTVAHPFHVHLVQFQIVGVEDLSGNPLPIPVEFLGPNDNIMVPSGQQVTIRMIFDSYGSSMPFDVNRDTYMYHCHILTHEDGYYALGYNSTVPNTPNIEQREHWGMMQQFVVWDGTVSRDLSQPLGPELTLFPNPAGDELNLNGDCTKLSTLKVYDLQGKLLMEKLLRPFSGTKTVDISDLQRGLVVVEWTSPEGRYTRKLIVE